MGGTHRPRILSPTTLAGDRGLWSHTPLVSQHSLPDRGRAGWDRLFY